MTDRESKRFVVAACWLICIVCFVVTLIAFISTVNGQSSWEQQLRRDRPSRQSTAVTRRTANEAKYPALRVLPETKVSPIPTVRSSNVSYFYDDNGKVCGRAEYHDGVVSIYDFTGKLRMVMILPK